MTAGLTRRGLMIGIAALAVASPASAEPRRMSAGDAHAAAQRGDILLLDIRTRDEWRETGVGETAHAVSMHESDFLDRLQSLTSGNKSRSVALICAVGGRSRSLQRVLTKMGYSQIIDVSEGMVGGVNGNGWLKSGLPVKPYRQ